MGDRIERLDKTEVVIGRSVQADIVVAHAEVSRRHVTLRVESGQVTICDEGSKNGTFLDELRLPAQSKTPWREGQTLRMGLAPERLGLERIADHRVGVETPPPVDTVAHRTATRSQVLKDFTVSEIAVTQANSMKQSPQVVARAEVKAETGSIKELFESKPSLVADLERQIQGLLENAEREANALRAGAERECQHLRANAERDVQRIQDEAKLLKLEKSKLENQLRELESELQARTEDRKQIARENADAKLMTQNLETEVDRLLKAKEQIGLQMGEELAHLEAKLADATFEADKISEGLKSRAQKETKDLLDKAKRQAELLVSEAELKAKAQRDKVQVEIADSRRQLELDLAEMKLKHTSEVKGAHDQQEALQLKNRQQMVSTFLQEIRTSSDMQAAGPAVRVRLLEALEESLHRHFLRSEMPVSPRSGLPNSTARIPESPSALTDMEVTSGSGIRIDSISSVVHPAETATPPVRRFDLRVVSMVLVGLIGVGGLGGAWMMYSGTLEKAGRQIASQPVASPPTPAPAPAQVQTQAPPPVPETPAPPPEPVATRTWTDVVTSSSASEWQSSAGRYLQKSLKVDRRKVVRYQILESRLANSLAAVDSRSPAGVRERERIEEQFVRDADQILGASTLQKLAEYRDYFMSKNQ